MLTNLVQQCARDWNFEAPESGNDFMTMRLYAVQLIGQTAGLKDKVLRLAFHLAG